MCGIAGIVRKVVDTENINAVKLMTNLINHRGPDGDGHWVSKDGIACLGHRRLAIIDVSDSGHQPMRYYDRYTITFNGEIYNYLELRQILEKEGYKFRTKTDTEVLLALFAHKGVKCLELLDGMFSFAIYDEVEQMLFCARDRFGEKPFYYSYQSGESFVFASEMKALWAGGVPKRVNENMLFGYLVHGILENVDNKSETFYEDISKLEPAHYILMDTRNLSLSKHRYWEVSAPRIDSIGLDDAAERFRDLMETSVRRRLRSDVPVGSSLSGGLDSSLIVCLVNKALIGTGQSQKTFSARFPGFVKDEGKYMDLVINETQAQPFFTYPDEYSMFEMLDKVAYHQEEPFGSASIMVQFEVMKMAKENGVIVLLDGQGADEILAGYHYYYPIYFREVKRLNKNIYNKVVAEFRELHRNNSINKYEGGKAWTIEHFGEYTNRFLKLAAKYKQFKSGSLNREFFQKNVDNVSLDSKSRLYRFADLNQALHYSTFSKGLEELLRYADRNSMANSREVRLPFLSHELVEFLFSLPAEYKIRHGWTKYLMRHAYDDLLPKEIAWRKDKIGYEPPQNSWLSAPKATERVQNAMEILSKNHVLSKSGSSQSVQAIEAALKWRYLMSANLFS